MGQNERAAKLATLWWGERFMVSGKEQAFMDALEPKILAALEEDGRAFLECDYDPQDLLLEAVREAGVECQGFMFSAKGILPQKHSLTVRPNVLTPKEGYGNWTKEIPVPTSPDIARRTRLTHPMERDI